MLKFVEDSINMVIVGNWNLQIFTPEWIAKNVFKSNDNMQVEFSLNNLNAPFRFSKDNVRIIPSTDRVTFFPQKHNHTSFSRIEKMVQDLCQLLSHTPITAYGVNFIVMDEDPDPQLLGRFNLTDDIYFSDAGFDIKSRKIVRSIPLENGILNLEIYNEDGNVRIQFNFHYPVTGAEAIEQNIIGQFGKCKQIFEQIITDIYNNNIEEGED